MQNITKDSRLHALGFVLHIDKYEEVELVPESGPGAGIVGYLEAGELPAIPEVASDGALSGEGSVKTERTAADREDAEGDLGGSLKVQRKSVKVFRSVGSVKPGELDGLPVTTPYQYVDRMRILMPFRGYVVMRLIGLGWRKNSTGSEPRRGLLRALCMFTIGQPCSEGSSQFNAMNEILFVLVVEE